MADPRNLKKPTLEAVLRGARQRLGEGWCKHNLAIGPNKKPIDPRLLRAQSFDIEGSIIASAFWAAHQHRDEVAWDIERQGIELLAQFVCKPGEIEAKGARRVLSDYNDHPDRIFGEVRCLIDEALLMLEGTTHTANRSCT